MLIVQKYGGSSLADTPRIRNAARRIAGLAQQGARMVVVVSAQGNTTDELITGAELINSRGAAREMDMCLAVGEQLSASLMAMAIGALGVPAISLTGWQAGIKTDATYQNARITGLENDRIRQELEKGNVVVVAGFQGISPNGDITTLGRGGSDTTAVALAAFLQADLCQIYTDVDGIYDRDPRLYPGATRFGRIGYEKMRRLIEGGAQVLHDRSVEIAQKYGIAVEVLSAFTGAPGTILTDLP